MKNYIFKHSFQYIGRFGKLQNRTARQVFSRTLDFKFAVRDFVYLVYKQLKSFSSTACDFISEIFCTCATVVLAH